MEGVGCAGYIQILWFHRASLFPFFRPRSKELKRNQQDHHVASRWQLSRSVEYNFFHEYNARNLMKQTCIRIVMNPNQIIKLNLSYYGYVNTLCS